MSEWTPGPWEINHEGGLSNQIVADSGQRLYEGDNGRRSVALFQACCASQRFDDQERNKLGNARLIAAAPDLYEALEQIIAKLGATEKNDGHKDIWRNAFDALAKARGEA